MCDATGTGGELGLHTKIMLSNLVPLIVLFDVLDTPPALITLIFRTLTFPVCNYIPSEDM
jgi:hypothetical protein